MAFPGGIALRSYGALGPSFHDRVKHFRLGGMPLGQAHDLAIYEQTGLRTGNLAQAAEVVRSPDSSPFAFTTEDGGADPNCAGLDARHTPTAATRLEAMALSPEPWASFGRIGKALPTDHQADFAEAAFQDRCKQGGAR